MSTYSAIMYHMSKYTYYDGTKLLSLKDISGNQPERADPKLSGPSGRTQSA